MFRSPDLGLTELKLLQTLLKRSWEARDPAEEEHELEYRLRYMLSQDLLFHFPLVWHPTMHAASADPSAGALILNTSSTRLQSLQSPLWKPFLQVPAAAGMSPEFTARGMQAYTS